MANKVPLAILKESLKKKDPRIWNRWHFKQHDRIDLSEADLSGLHFDRIDIDAFPADDELGDDPWGRYNLSNVSLRGAKLSNCFFDVTVLFDALLMDADLSGANLLGVFLNGADLTKADLSNAEIVSGEAPEATLEEANFFRTKISNTDFSDANLLNAKFVECSLGGSFTRAKFARGKVLGCTVAAGFTDANLLETDFTSSDLSKASFKGTILGNLDLSNVRGLEEATHNGPSVIGADTLAKSKGAIPDAFLRGCGLSDWAIEQAKLYKPDLSNDRINEILYKVYDLRATRALQISNLFISYSHADGEFVDKLEGKLNELGVRHWRDIHDMKAGRMEKQIDRAIRQNPTVLLVLSEHSLQSDWVEHEVRTARGLEKEIGRDVLCPVALDDSWKSSHWPERVMEQIMEYNILNFSEWKDDGKFEGMFHKLIDGLELFYKG